MQLRAIPSSVRRRWSAVAICAAGVLAIALVIPGSAGSWPQPDSVAAAIGSAATPVATTSAPIPSSTPGVGTGTPVTAGSLAATPTAGTHRAYIPLVLKVQPTPPAAPTATATPSPTPVPAWLARVNQLRALGGLAALTENPEWSAGCVKHATYMVKNQDFGHTQVDGAPFTTAEGKLAAVNSEYYFHDNVDAPDEIAINWWLSGPFHLIPVIDPQLTRTGFGSYREAVAGRKMAACLDVMRGLGPEPPSSAYPIMWPGNGQVTPLLNYGGFEYPDPLPSCNYASPAGPPIALQVGPGGTPLQVTAHSLKRNGVEIDHCVFHADTYTNQDGTAQSVARAVLRDRDAVIVMPRQILQSGFTYAVSLTVNGRTYAWSFRAGGLD